MAKRRPPKRTSNPPSGGGGLSIPPIPENLQEPVRALVRAASTFNRAFIGVAGGLDAKDLVAEHQDVLLLAERVIGLWRDHFGLEVEELWDSLDE